MILLLGGTSESRAIALSLAARGRRVLLSMATATPFALESNAFVELRRGALDLDAMCALIRSRAVCAVVDATHPYATVAHDVAAQAAHACNVRYVRWHRASTDLADGVLAVASHVEAATLAATFARPVLLTIGTRHVAPYLERIAHGVTARILPTHESLDAARAAGLKDDAIIAARPPFTVEQNRRDIRFARAGVLVTKDGGAPAGVAEKLEAARLEGCTAIVVRRPEATASSAVSDLDALLAALV